MILSSYRWIKWVIKGQKALASLFSEKAFQMGKGGEKAWYVWEIMENPGMYWEWGERSLPKKSGALYDLLRGLDDIWY